MAERTHAVRLRLEVDQLKRDAAQASRAVSGIGAAAQEAGGKSRLMGALGDAARGVGRTVAAIGTVAAGSMAALGASVIRTGVSYNTLEQNTRAALTTLLGGAEAATAQMNELREFVRTALFPREAFIEAQQNMLSFGFAAERVVPILSAVQDAVAATGGSAQRFSEVVEILSRIQSTGQITAGTLNELGRRGINAAQLIGQAMGQTENDIRESISRGALDGREAIDVLVDAMEARFAGAAELISNTWVGAAGLVSAALRDIGSALVEPFIDPAGGGAAVEWARNLADVLYALEGQIRDVVTVFRDNAEPVFARTSDRLLDMADAIGQADISGLIDRVADGAPVFAAFGAAAAAAGSAGILSAVGMGRLAAAISPVGAGIAALVATSPELRQVLVDLLAALAPLVPIAVDLGAAAGRVLTPALAALAAVLGPIVTVVEAVVSVFDALPGPVQTSIVAFSGLMALVPRLQAAGAGLAAPFVRLREEMALQRGLASMAGQEYDQFGLVAQAQVPRLGNLGAAAASAGSGISRLRTSAAGVVSFFTGPWGIALAAAAVGLSIWASNQRDATADVEEHTAALDEQTGAITANNREIVRADLAQREFKQGFGEDSNIKSFTGVLQAANVEMSQAIDATLGINDAMHSLETQAIRLEREVERSGASWHTMTDAQKAAHEAKREQFIATLLLIDAIKDEIPAVEEAQENWRFYEDASSDSEEQQGETEAAVRSTTAALKDQHEQLKAQTDPVFALFKAMRDLESAQESYDEVLGDSEATQQDVKAAALGLLEAAVGLQGAAGDASGEFTGKLTPAMKAALEAAGMTEDEIEAVGAALADTREELEGYEGRYEAEIELQGAEEAEKAARLLRDRLRQIDRTVTIAVNVSGFDSAAASGVVVPQFAAGGGVEHGLPGVDRVPALLTRGEHVWTVREVQAAGGHQNVEALRAAVLAGTTRFATGGPVGAAALQGGGAVTAAGGVFTGNLYLDSGEWLGKVRGEVRAGMAEHDHQLVGLLTQDTGGAR